jgi:hypothetical protein
VYIALNFVGVASIRSPNALGQRSEIGNENDLD